MKDNINVEIAERIKGLREIQELSKEKMASILGVSLDDYSEFEKGNKDFTFSMIFNASNVLGVSLTEIVTGDSSRLKSYTLERKGQGMKIERRQGFSYLHLASLMKDRSAEPFLVSAPYVESDQNKPIKTNSHKGQEFDYIIKGTLKVTIDGHTEILNEGDSLYYDSSLPHGMIATGGKECAFLAILIK